MNKNINFILSTVLIAGCQQMQPQQLASSGPTMRDIYQQQLNSNVTTKRWGIDNDSLTIKRPISNSQGGNIELTVNTQTFPFERVNNPDIAFYIFPHITAKQKIPVAGTMALFPLYAKVYYQHH